MKHIIVCIIISYKNRLGGNHILWLQRVYSCNAQSHVIKTYVIHLFDKAIEKILIVNDIPLINKGSTSAEGVYKLVTP